MAEPTQTYIKRGDLKPDLIYIARDDSQAADLRLVASWRLIARTAGGILFVDTAPAVTINNLEPWRAQLIHVWNAPETAIARRVTVEAEAMWPGNKPQTFPAITVDIKPDLDTPDEIVPDVLSPTYQLRVSEAQAAALRAEAAAATYATGFDRQLARNPDMLVTGVVTRDASGAATSAPVTWPDGTPGMYTATVLSSEFPGAVDAYTITYGSPVTKTYTQPTITRDATTGAATFVPAVTVS